MPQKDKNQIAARIVALSTGQPLPNLGKTVRVKSKKTTPKGSYFGWSRTADGMIVVDAKPDNFIKTSVGLVPIDLQMTQFSSDEMKSAGLI